MTSIWGLANPQLRDLVVYEPGKPIEETAHELGIDPAEIIKLASNENPLGPSLKAARAMRAALENAHLYPDGSGFYLCKAIAAKLGVATENIILGNGSNEVIEFLGHAFLNPGDDVVTFQYAFIIYKLLAAAFSVRTIETLCPDYQQDLEETLNTITPKTRLIFIANPNNPTGTLVSQRAIDRFMSRVPENIVVVFDEAYFEFLDDPPDTLQYVHEERNVVVLRTFSKIHGLAGLRIGYGVARPDDRSASQDEAAIQREQPRASGRARSAQRRCAPARDEARDRRRSRLFAETIFRNANPFRASRGEFCDGKRRRWVCRI